MLLLLFCLGIGPAAAIESLDDIQVGGKYRMILTTGDRLVGTVEFKDDTSLIVETTEQPFSFRGTLILEYEMLEPPPPSRSLSSAGGNAASGEGTIVTYDELMRRGSASGRVQVRISNGSVFVGDPVSVDASTLRLDVEGSIIPIDRSVIRQVVSTAAPANEPPRQSAAKSQPAGPEDTVMVTNPKTDEYGQPLAPLVIVGKIQEETRAGVTVVTSSGARRTFPRDRIARVIRHSTADFEAPIKRYAKPLFCPEGMILVDLPPGKDDRPFFKVCVDKYEFPNQKGAVPQGNVSYREAQQLCQTHGKRLCTAEEWQWACSGIEGYTYPYGWQFEKKKCNIDGGTDVEASGTRRHCVGKFGIYDMTGNIFEWVTGQDGKPMLMGGPYAKCQTVSPGVGGGAKPQTGFRCCLSN
jgi:hypothetical protein